MRPADIGVPASRLVLGKHSGRHAFKERAEALGFSLSEEQINAVFEKFKALADKKKDVYDEDIEALIDEQMGGPSEVWVLKAVQSTAGSSAIPTATVTLEREGQSVTDAATGDGPVDAAISALNRICKVKGVVEDYRLRAVTKGGDALGEVTIRTRLNGVAVGGKGLSTDIVHASALAYLDAVNRAGYRTPAKT
jgi:2-isopropylmalate synthase